MIENEVVEVTLKLNRSEWCELANAVHSKMRGVEDGQYDEAGIREIDDVVNHELETMGSAINNNGLEAQIMWLKDRGWTDHEILNFYAATENE